MSAHMADEADSCRDCRANRRHDARIAVIAAYEARVRAIVHQVLAKQRELEAALLAAPVGSVDWARANAALVAFLDGSGEDAERLPDSLDVGLGGGHDCGLPLDAHRGMQLGVSLDSGDLLDEVHGSPSVGGGDAGTSDAGELIVGAVPGAAGSPAPGTSRVTVRLLDADGVEKGRLLGLVAEDLHTVDVRCDGGRDPDAEEHFESAEPVPGGCGCGGGLAKSFAPSPVDGDDDVAVDDVEVVDVVDVDRAVIGGHESSSRVAGSGASTPDGPAMILAGTPDTLHPGVGVPAAVEFPSSAAAHDRVEGSAPAGGPLDVHVHGRGR